MTPELGSGIPESQGLNHVPLADELHDLSRTKL
jgi:hypothetical protein